MIKRKGDFVMDELLEWLNYIEDNRQQAKVRHKLKDIIVIAGEDSDQRPGSDDRCHGNPDCYSREDPFQAWRLCIGIRGKPKDAV